MKKRLGTCAWLCVLIYDCTWHGHMTFDVHGLLLKGRVGEYTMKCHAP